MDSRSQFVAYLCLNVCKHSHKYAAKYNKRIWQMKIRRRQTTTRKKWTETKTKQKKQQHQQQQNEL